MDSTKARRATALLVVLGLLVTAGPAAAAPERAAGEPAIASSLFQAFTAWLARLLPVSGPAASPAPACAATGAGAALELQPRGETHAEGDPTAEPQLGGDIDPDG